MAKVSYFRAVTVLAAMLAAAVVAVLVGYGSASAQDGGGDNPGAPGGDTTPPEVVRTFPADGVTNVDPYIKSIKAKFSEKMDKEQFDLYPQKIRLTEPGAPTSIPDFTGPYYISYNSKKKTASWNLKKHFGSEFRLKPNTLYKGHIDRATKDKAGNLLGEEYTWTFTTGAS
jgi:hypothetical protein